MALLWAKQIIGGMRKFSDVPRLLKADVRQILIDRGRPELAEE